MTDFLLTLKIDKVGDREALNALNDLDLKGQKIIEGVAGATGRAMGDIAVAYEQGSARVKRQLETIADGHYENIKAMEAEQRSAEKALASVATQMETGSAKAERSSVAVSRALETMARTGREGGRSLDTVIAQLSSGFGLGGPVVGAIGIATVAIIELFQKASRESKKVADDITKDFDRIAHLAVAAQGEEASRLYSGDQFSTGIDRFGMKELERQRADFQRRVAAGTSTFTGAYGVTTKSLSDDAAAAAEALKKVNAELERRNTLLASVTGPGGSIQRAGVVQAAEDLPGFVGDQIKARDAVQKTLDADLRRRAKEAAREAEAYQREMLSDARDAANQMVNDAKWHDDYLSGLLGLPTKAEADRQWKAGMFALDASISEAIKNNAFLNAKKEFDKSVETLSKHMHDELQKTLGDGLTAGFEAAFTGKGITGAFEALTASVLGGLGGFMEQLGAQMIVIGVSLDALASSLLSLNGPGAIAAGVALIAAGAGLKAIAGSFGRSSSGGGASSGSASSASPSFLSFGVPAGQSAVPVTSQSAPAAREAINLMVIGDGPKVQRDLATIINSANRRNLLDFAPAR